MQVVMPLCRQESPTNPACHDSMPNNTCQGMHGPLSLHVLVASKPHACVWPSCKTRDSLKHGIQGIQGKAGQAGYFTLIQDISAFGHISTCRIHFLYLFLQMKLLHGTLIVSKRPRQLHAPAASSCSIHVVFYCHNLENGMFGSGRPACKPQKSCHVYNQICTTGM